MKILKIKDKDLCRYDDWLIGSAANEFVAGGYTHIEIEGEVIICEFTGQQDDGSPMILLGES